MFKKIPFPLIALLLSITTTHYLSLQYAWYVRNPWLDIVMHGITGLAIAYAVYWFLDRIHADTFKTRFFAIIIPTLFVGVLWEYFEYYYDITGWPIGTLNYKLDTMKDIVMDTLGAIVVWIIARKK